LINEMLDLTKIEAGHVDLLLEAHIDLLPEIDDVVGITRALIGDKAISLQTAIAVPLPLITADRRRIRQVPLNLMSNAVKFTESGYIRLRVWHDVQTLYFAVADSGAGIPPEEQGRIFQPFHQRERDRQHVTSTGLGLPIAQKLVELHHGKLRLESTSELGSTFMFSLTTPAQRYGEANYDS